jgi:hypothetical protein
MIELSDRYEENSFLLCDKNLWNSYLSFNVVLALTSKYAAQIEK